MGRFFTDDTLVEYDRMNETTLPDSGAVEKEVTTQGPGGVPITVWQPISVWPVAIHPASAGNQLRYQGGSAARVALWDVTFPKDAQLDITHRIKVLIGARATIAQTQVIVYVVGSQDPQTNATQYIVTAEQRAGA